MDQRMEMTIRVAAALRDGFRATPSELPQSPYINRAGLRRRGWEEEDRTNITDWADEDRIDALGPAIAAVSTHWNGRMEGFKWFCWKRRYSQTSFSEFSFLVNLEHEVLIISHVRDMESPSVQQYQDFLKDLVFGAWYDYRLNGDSGLDLEERPVDPPKCIIFYALDNESVTWQTVKRLCLERSNFNIDSLDPLEDGSSYPGCVTNDIPPGDLETVESTMYPVTAQERHRLHFDILLATNEGLWTSLFLNSHKNQLGRARIASFKIWRAPTGEINLGIDILKE